MLARSKKYAPLSSRKERRRNRLRLFWGLVFLNFVIGVVVLGLFFELDRFQIEEVNLSGVSTADRNLVESLVKDSIAGTYLGIFPKNSIFLYPKGSIAQRVLAEELRIKEVDAYIEPTQVLNLKLAEREPKALACEESAEECFFLDEESLVYGKAPVFSGNVYPRFFGYSIVEGETLMPKAVFGELTLFMRELSILGYKIAEITRRDFNQLELLTDLGVKIFVKPEQELNVALAELKLALSSGDSAKTFKNFNLEYIDLRDSGRIYYKVRKN